MMKKLTALLFAVCILFGVVACEDAGDEGVLFLNQSSYLVQVRPNGDPFWDGFSLPPGERYRVNTSRDVFFVYEPVTRVSVGKNESRTIIFVDANENAVEVSE